MIVTVFRSRLNPGVEEDYKPMAVRLSELARSMPGYVSHKGFVAEDGERVTIVEFEDEDALRAWATHPDHIQGKKRGIREFFSDYGYQICEVKREFRWAAEDQARDRPAAKVA